MSIEILLARLDKVKQTQPDTWQARCPAHDDKTPSLRIKAVDDGRILIHCFAGCGAVAVMDAVGMRMGDLMPAPLSNHLKAIKRPYVPQDVFKLVEHEAIVLAIIAGDMARGVAIDRERLAVAQERLELIAAGAYG